jgi:hypothetical protein
MEMSDDLRSTQRCGSKGQDQKTPGVVGQYAASKIDNLEQFVGSCETLQPSTREQIDVYIAQIKGAVSALMGQASSLAAISKIRGERICELQRRLNERQAAVDCVSGALLRLSCTSKKTIE